MRHLLSFYQQQVWRHQNHDPAGVHHVSRGARMSGVLQTEALRQTIDVVVTRHASLRTHFDVDEGNPVQVIERERRESLRTIDLCGVKQSDRERLVDQLLGQVSERPFDPSASAPFRIALIRLGQCEHLVTLTIHRLICDDYSADIFCREMSQLYAAFSSGTQSVLKEPGVQYIDQTEWLRDQLAEEKLQEQVRYWDRQLRPPLSFVHLPIRRNRSVGHRGRRSIRHSMFSPARLKSLKELGVSNEATLFMVLLAGFNALLHRYTGQEDILVGFEVAGRSRPGTADSIGLFANTILLRTNLSSELNFSELLTRIRRLTLDAYAHEEFPCESLLNSANSGEQFVPMMFNLRTGPRSDMEFTGLKTLPAEVERNSAGSDLVVELLELTDGLTITCSYSDQLYEADALSRLIRHYGVLLEDAANNPRRSIRELSLLTPGEGHQLELEWNDTQGELQTGVCIHELIEAEASSKPDAVALTCNDSHLTYRELNERATQGGNYLQRLGVRAEVRVGIFSDRTLEMVIGLVAIMKAGGTYVPLDPAYPAERLAFMVDDSHASVVLAQTSLLDSLPESEAEVVRMDQGLKVCAGENRERCVSTIGSGNAAYLIYTSGSTGVPKGVVIEHRSAVVLSQWARGLFGSDDLAAVLASTSICFDLSVFELFFPLSWGGKVILVENALSASKPCADQQVTLINTGPSIMAGMLRTGRLPGSVRTVNLAGEVLKSELVQKIYTNTSVTRVFNLYGPSEDTTYSTFALINRDDECEPPIGVPITNSQVYLLDFLQEQTPLGAQGELYLGGEGLARGYLDRPDTTAERFVPNPFGDKPGARLYRTGDLSRNLPNGGIEFLGRIDHQVKIHGLRIELGEIEVVLAGHEAVREAVVLSSVEDSGQTSLVAYVVPALEPGTTENELRRYLIDKLPHYMIPSTFVMMGSLPLTPNGKVDRKALPAIEARKDPAGESFVAPRTPLEESLAAVWSEVLGRSRVGVGDNFFRLGGHSLLGARLISRVRDEFNVGIYLDALFRAPSVAEMAVLITERRAEQTLEVDLSAVLAELEGLSDENAQRMLDEIQRHSD
jgi:amino acid adenylation domain-containing protein